LEHVEYPQKVIKEFYRILKPKGKLFLTAPLAWRLHSEPYHFYNFTKYGLESLFKNAGFKVIFIKKRGGLFWFLEEIIKIIPPYIFFQQVFKKGKKALKFKLTPLAFIPPFIWFPCLFAIFCFRHYFFI
jgi:SAM-dependent methyltransferase